MAEEAISPGGAVIHRHSKPAEYQRPFRQRVYAAEIEEHLENFLGPSDFVFHELVSDQVHVDILQFPPTAERPHWTLVTSGMSDLPMTVPAHFPDREFLEHAELVVSLPADWVQRDASGQMDAQALRFEAKWWPLHWLGYLARFPHKYGTWLWLDHSIPNGDPPKPLAAGTEMSGFALSVPSTWPKASWVLTTARGPSITFIAIYPVFPEEMEFKLREGAAAFFERLFESGATEVIDPARPNFALRR